MVRVTHWHVLPEGMAKWCCDDPACKVPHMEKKPHPDWVQPGEDEGVPICSEVETNESSEMTNERKNITQPADWWIAFEQQAKAEGLTLAAWIGERCKAGLPAKVAKKLSARPPANRPKKPE